MFRRAWSSADRTRIVNTLLTTVMKSNAQTLPTVRSSQLTLVQTVCLGQAHVKVILLLITYHCTVQDLPFVFFRFAMLGARQLPGQPD